MRVSVIPVASKSATTVLLVDEDSARAEHLQQVFGECGYQVVARLGGVEALLDSALQMRPQLVVLSVNRLTEAALRSLSALNQHKPHPVVIFAEKDAPQVIEQTVKAGVSAYVVDTVQTRRVHSIFTLAIARFKDYQSLRAELEQTKSQLSARKILDKAKGLLMQQHGMSEEQAYHALRKMAMDKGLTLAAVAQNIVDVLSLFDGSSKSTASM